MEWATNSSARSNEPCHTGRVREKYHANADDSLALSLVPRLWADGDESGCDSQQPAEANTQQSGRRSPSLNRDLSESTTAKAADVG